MSNDPAAWATNAAYLRGIELFNNREFWEAHEAWEEIWLVVDGVQSDFLQGLIQCSAALLKYSRDEAAPAQRLYKTAKEKLDRCPDFYMGLNVREFQRAMAIAFQPIINGTLQSLDASAIPIICVSNSPRP
jgi:predicted metal-dependent hydrolase